VAGVASATVANVGGRLHSGDEGPLVSGERPVLTQVRSMGLWIRFSHGVAPALAWTLNKLYAGKGSVGGPRAIAVTGVGELPHQP